MNHNNYIQKIKEHEALNALINEKRLDEFSSFRDVNKNDLDFIEWISPKYYESFTEIFRKNIGTKTEGKVIALLDAPQLCNKETRAKIIPYLLPPLDKSLAQIKEFNTNIIEKNNIFIDRHNLILINDAFSYLPFTIFRNFQESDIKVRQDAFITIALNICDRLKHSNPRTDVNQFTVYNLIINKLKTIKIDGSLNERFQSHTQKLVTKKKNYNLIYYAATAIGVILLIIKLLSNILF